VVIGAHGPSGRPPYFIYSLCVAATNDAAQDRIGERGRHRLAVGEQYGSRQNGLDARQAITLAGSIDAGRLGLPCCVGNVEHRDSCRATGRSLGIAREPMEPMDLANMRQNGVNRGKSIRHVVGLSPGARFRRRSGGFQPRPEACSNSSQTAVPSNACSRMFRKFPLSTPPRAFRQQGSDQYGPANEENRPSSGPERRRAAEYRCGNVRTLQKG
jgi:hypothetical protein